jgi:hypothetical protein
VALGHTKKEEITKNARELIMTYYQAWTTGDFGTARRCLSDALDFKGSIDTFQNADDFLKELVGFKGMLRGVVLLKSYFDQNGGALLYDCDTVTPAGVIRASEFFSVDKDRITEIRLVFDATELRRLMGAR